MQDVAEVAVHLHDHNRAPDLVDSARDSVVASLFDLVQSLYTRVMSKPCPCCGGATVLDFESTVRGRYHARYLTCRSCGSLFIEDPHWIDEAHRDFAGADRVDGGARWRSDALVGLLLRLAPLVPSGPWLDYGSGHGLLVADLVSRGYDCTGYDSYRESSLSEREFALVSCFEVLEHQIEPQALINRLGALAKYDGLIVLSTWLRDPAHRAGWPYLSKEIGQHVCFPSIAGFATLCRRAELLWLRSASNIENPQLQVHLVAYEPIDGIADAVISAGFQPFRP